MTSLSKMFGDTTLVVSGLILGVLSLLFILKRNRRNFPPGPFAFPLIGNVHQLGPEPHKTFHAMRQKYGDIFSLKLGGFPAIVINGMDNIQDALLTMKDSFADRSHFFANVLNPVGVAFHDMRNDVSWRKKHIVKALGTLNSDKTFNLNTVLELTQEDLVSDFMKQDGKPFDPYDAQHLASVCAGYRFLFNKDVNLRYADGNFNFKLLVEREKDFIYFTSIVNICNVIPWLRWIYPWGYKKVLALNEDLIQLTVHDVNKLIETKQSQIRGAADIFQEVNCKTAEIRQQLFLCLPELMAASFDTTATTLLWIYLFLVKNEAVQKRVQSAIDKTIGQSKVTLKDRKTLPIVDALILEVMRMELPIPLGLPKCASKDCDFKGYRIPRGTVVLTNFHSINRDPLLWKNPETFWPERFLKADGSLDREKEHRIFAFGIGQRKCPGEAVARAQMFVAVASILQRFHLKKVVGENYDVIGVPGLTSSTPPFKIIAEARLDNIE